MDSLNDKNQGGSYFGEYKNNERHGRGILRSREGDVYVGGFEDGLYSGYGKVTFADGSFHRRLVQERSFIAIT